MINKNDNNTLNEYRPEERRNKKVGSEIVARKKIEVVPFFGRTWKNKFSPFSIELLGLKLSQKTAQLLSKNDSTSIKKWDNFWTGV